MTPHRVDEATEKMLGKSGMSVRERRSTVEQITPEILERIPADVLRACEAGERPSGFGLIGPVGVGKSGAVAALMMRTVRQRIASGQVQTEYVSRETGGYIKPPVLLRWCSWPETVNDFRVIAGQSEGMQQVEDMARRLSRAWLLVIDDLGAERIRTGYDDDWATSLLDLVIDRRYTNCDPVWYTSSLTRAELVQKYGRRMFERLGMDNPWIEIEGVKSRRQIAWRAAS